MFSYKVAIKLLCLYYACLFASPTVYYFPDYSRCFLAAKVTLIITHVILDRLIDRIDSFCEFMHFLLIRPVRSERGLKVDHNNVTFGFEICNYVANM